MPPVVKGPQKPPESPQTGLTLTWPDGKVKEFKASKAGAVGFLNDLEVASAVNRDTWELNKSAVAFMIETAKDDEVKARAVALENAMEETELAAG